MKRIHKQFAAAASHRWGFYWANGWGWVTDGDVMAGGPELAATACKPYEGRVLEVMQTSTLEALACEPTSSVRLTAAALRGACPDADRERWREVCAAFKAHNDSRRRGMRRVTPPILSADVLGLALQPRHLDWACFGLRGTAEIVCDAIAWGGNGTSPTAIRLSRPDGGVVIIGPLRMDWREQVADEIRKFGADAPACFVGLTA